MVVQQPGPLMIDGITKHGNIPP